PSRSSTAVSTKIPMPSLLCLLPKSQFLFLIPLSLSHSQKARIWVKRKSGGRRGEKNAVPPSADGVFVLIMKV
ncbi:hypothetical protein MKC55_24990, partial [[Clostridium] innocuum]|nr:hypothetical protein [[Clostridium] innocuum]